MSPQAQSHLRIAQRVADAHRPLDHDGSLLALVSGSTVDDRLDELSDVDMSIVFDTLPPEAALREACRRVGDDWFWSAGDLAAGEGGVVAFRVEGVEVQIAYTTHAALARDLDDLLVAHNPDTPNHKLAEGLAKALPLVNAGRLASVQARLATFPEGLRESMVRHGLATPIPWRAARQLLRRDAALWCREIQVEAGYRLLLVLAGLNRCWFTRFQVKRLRRLADKLPLAPASWVERLEALLAAPPAEAFAALHALEGEVLALVAREMPSIDLAALHARRAGFVPASAPVAADNAAP